MTLGTSEYGERLGGGLFMSHTNYCECRKGV